MKFLLTKYYMDCVTAEGDVALCYASDLTVGGVKLRQSSVLLHEEGKTTENKQSFVRGVLPRHELFQWVWDCPALNVHGKWSPQCKSGADIALYETDEGKAVNWQCLTPRATAELNIKGKNLKGTGYVECLNMTLEPWKLPMNVLHWGRFHPLKGDSFAWIIWEGAHPLSLLMVGELHATFFDMRAARDGSRIDVGDKFSLIFSRQHVLRTGDIGQTALKKLPAVMKNLLPASILHLKETKWAGPAILRNHREDIPGFAIHEVVNFLPEPN